MPAKRVVLCILDGWGESREASNNGIACAHTPVWLSLRQHYPTSQLEASGQAVGLPEGQMGNSEVGHMTLGLGRVILQDLPRIDKAIDQSQLPTNKTLQEFIHKVKQGTGRCHLLGLLSPGGVHAHQRHILAFAKIFAEAGIKVLVHAFLDGRDTPPQSAQIYFKDFLKSIASHPNIQLATLGGRYYGMDRDNRWDRTEKAYRVLVEGQAPPASDLLALIKTSYDQGITDEFITPHQCAGYQGMCDGDGLFMANFRADRARQILLALLRPEFTHFSRPQPIRFAATLGLTPYSDELNAFIPPLFERQAVIQSLGELIAQREQKQLRIAETEKYAHVTFFFNGGQEIPFLGEDRLLIPSPTVSTYDLAPEMSALPLTEKAIAAIESQQYELIVLNYANTDMVGHTGVVDAILKSIQTVDSCLGQLVTAVHKTGATLIITADHGNVEQLFDQATEQPHTAHTCNPVPFIVINAPSVHLRPHGTLADVAPTILDLMEIPIPAVMSGQSLVEKCS